MAEKVNMALKWAKLLVTSQAAATGNKYLFLAHSSTAVPLTFTSVAYLEYAQYMSLTQQSAIVFGLGASAALWVREMFLRGYLWKNYVSIRNHAHFVIARNEHENFDFRNQTVKLQKLREIEFGKGNAKEVEF